MIQQQLQVGAERFTISADTLAEILEKGKDFKLMDYRLRTSGGKDATFRIRTNDGGDFLEAYSPSLNAAKMVSKEMPPSTKIYIGADTPWVRYVKSEVEGEEGTSLVRFDVITDQVRALGWTDEDKGRFVPAERVKSEGKRGVKRAWTWAPIRD